MRKLSLKCDMIADPPIQFSSKEDGHLCLFGALYNDFRQLPDLETIQNSIVFAPIDCSNYSSVILSFETNFINLGGAGDWQCLVEVSNNYGVHWASYSADLNGSYKVRPNCIEPGEKTLFDANITNVAAGMSDVLIKIYWYNDFGIYYWSIDDLKLSEGYSNDLRIENVGLVWDDQNSLTTESFSSMIPLGQLGHGHKLTDFNLSFVNMGELPQNDVIFEMTISKSNSKIFEESSELSFLDIGWRSELLIEDSFEPNETGGLADGEINFRYTIWKDIGDEAYIEPNLLLESDWRDLDSSMLISGCICL